MSLNKDEIEIHPIPVLEDNIIWVWTSKNKAVVIDPALSSPVQEWLERKQLTLQAILQTHHHLDHIGGTPGLLKDWPEADVIASKNDSRRIPLQTIPVSNKDMVSIMGYSLEIIEVSGHTNNHIAFFIDAEINNIKTPILFPGDTLFAGGCGRLFEGSPQDMFNSLICLSKLPRNTKIYCAHEYTESNLRWANNLYPDDLIIKKRLTEVIAKREKGDITLPSSIEEELKTNLFLRVKTLDEFTALRVKKDNW